MKNNKIIAFIGVTLLSGSLLTGCLPPIHQAVIGPDDKDNNQANATIVSTDTGNVDVTPAVTDPVEPDDGNTDNSDNNNPDVSQPEPDNNDNGNPGFTADYSATEEDYLKFLNDETEAMVSYLYTDYLEFEKVYTYSDMLQAINDAVDEDWGDGRKVTEVDYAMIDCGNDGYPEMALFMTIANGNYDPLYEYYIFKFYNGNLLIIDSYNAYYRSMGELNIYGVFYTYGSGGANRGYESYQRCNKDGIHEFIYSRSIESDIGEASIVGYQIPSYIDLPEDYPQYHETAGNIICYSYSFEEYSYENDGDDDYYNQYLDQFVYVFTDRQGEIVYPDEEYQKIYDQCGFTITDFEGVNKIIDGRLNELGMEKEELLNSFTENYVIPNWQVIDTFK